MIRYRCILCEEVWNYVELVHHLWLEHNISPMENIPFTATKSLFLPVKAVRISGGYKYYPATDEDVLNEGV